MKTIIQKAILKQTAIFFTYLILSSLMLFNRSGGADIFFAVTIGIALVLHIVILFTLIIKTIIKKEGKPPYVELFTILLLANIFIVFSRQYLEMMWWLTGR